MRRITVHDESAHIRSKRAGRLVGLAVCCAVILACAVNEALAQTPNDLPERLRRKVAPGPAAPWHAPDLRGYASTLKPSEQAPVDPARQYDLPELIDIAQRVNPETRVTWERARQAARKMSSRVRQSTSEICESAS